MTQGCGGVCSAFGVVVGGGQIFAGAVMAVLPVTFKHLNRPLHEELHDSFFGLYCLWLLWVITVRGALLPSPAVAVGGVLMCCVLWCDHHQLIVSLTMKVVASIWLYHEIRECRSSLPPPPSLHPD